uniref:C3H1-type domain-containing protein n=1 Tax=Anopheles funestus TaxID=62324 RepID=A0A182R369_ANOFN
MAYELLWDASYEYLEKNVSFVNSLTRLMLERANNHRSQLFTQAHKKSPTFLEDFKVAHDEVQNMGKTLQTVVNDWKSLFAEVTSNLCKQTIPQPIAPSADLTFDYIKPLLEYKVNEKVQLIVTYIPASPEGIFYAMDDSRKTDFRANFTPIQKTCKTFLNKPPPAGVVFMVYIDNLWTRAVCNVATKGKTPVAIYLLDLGEVLPYEDHVPKAMLPAEFISVPGYAMKCTIVPKAVSFPFNLYDIVSCNVVAVQNDLLVLEYNDEKQAFCCSIVEETITKTEWEQQDDVAKRTNANKLNNNQDKHEYSKASGRSTKAEQKAQQADASQSQTNVIKRAHNEQKEEFPIRNSSKDTNREEQYNVTQSTTKEIKSAPNGEKQEYAITRETFTEAELEQLDDISQSTSNAMKAVLGYVPKDDERLCKHYDPATKGCFKGSNCRLRHEPKDPDGWTLDKDTVSVSIPAQMEIPLPNTYITLHPTCIIDVDTFYAHVAGDEANYAKYEQLMAEMNDPEMIDNYKTLKLIPALGELVIAKYEDMWYRATVCDVFDNRISVFYVDYGNTATVGTNEVRRWEDRFKFLPFQAVYCRISNIQRIKPCHLQAIQQLHSCILDKPIRALIIDNKHPWEVLIYDEDNFDVGEALIMTKLALPRKPSKFDENSYIPG